MKNEKVSKYKIGFKFVTLLNLVMLVFLLETIVGQNSNALPQNQATIVAKIVPQPESPLQISIIRVENSNPVFQNIVFSVRNVSNQPIRAFTIAGESIVNVSFASKLLFPMEVYTSNISIERRSIKPSLEVNLLIDYVEFERGVSWGRDVYGKSKQIKLGRIGRIEAIRLLKSLLRDGNSMAISNFLNQNVSQMTVPKPSQNLNLEDERSFGKGFKTIIFLLQKVENRNPEFLVRKLNELETINQ